MDENGFLNERSTACLIFSSCELIQSTRKTAIMVVTKSPYAIFQAPCGCVYRLAILLTHTFKHYLKLLEARAQIAFQTASCHFHGHDRSHATGKTDYRGSNAPGVGHPCIADEFHIHGKRVEEAVRN